mmetsp:Transcript_20699/g.66789  ORF Transcript_20699/g.66789 Transcript_20699/m.66789 type:complete len:393 (+) Transcript_20699:1110-2288(+)
MWWLTQRSSTCSGRYFASTAGSSPTRHSPLSCGILLVLIGPSSALRVRFHTSCSVPCWWDGASTSWRGERPCTPQPTAVTALRHRVWFCSLASLPRGRPCGRFSARGSSAAGATRSTNLDSRTPGAAALKTASPLGSIGTTSPVCGSPLSAQLRCLTRATRSDSSMGVTPGAPPSRRLPLPASANTVTPVPSICWRSGSSAAKSWAAAARAVSSATGSVAPCGTNDGPPASKPWPSSAGSPAIDDRPVLMLPRASASPRGAPWPLPTLAEVPSTEPCTSCAGGAKACPGAAPAESLQEAEGGAAAEEEMGRPAPASEELAEASPPLASRGTCATLGCRFWRMARSSPLCGGEPEPPGDAPSDGTRPAGVVGAMPVLNGIAPADAPSRSVEIG